MELRQHLDDVECGQLLDLPQLFHLIVQRRFGHPTQLQHSEEAEQLLDIVEKDLVLAEHGIGVLQQLGVYVAAPPVAFEAAEHHQQPQRDGVYRRRLPSQEIHWGFHIGQELSDELRDVGFVCCPVTLEEARLVCRDDADRVFCASPKRPGLVRVHLDMNICGFGN